MKEANETAEGFNSLMVRLKVFAGSLNGSGINEFQFLDGAIKSCKLLYKIHCLIQFQFLDGAIKSLNRFRFFGGFVLFQFLDGAIKSRQARG